MEIKAIEQKIKKLEEMKRYAGDDRVVQAKDIIAEMKEDAGRLASGFDALDNYIDGFHAGQLVIVSGATGSGKTSFAQTLTHNFMSKGKQCLWFSYEVGMREFVRKMPEGIDTFYAPKQIKGNSISWLEQRIIESIAKYGTKIVFVDHLHYLLEMQKMSEAKSVSLLIGMMLRELKRICIEYDIIIFLLAHLKKIEAYEKPELEDLRDSSFVAQESDIVLMIWRHRQRDDSQPDGYLYKNKASVAVRKNRRTGNLGAFNIEYINNKFKETNDVPEVHRENKSSHYERGYSASGDVDGI